MNKLRILLLFCLIGFVFTSTAVAKSEIQTQHLLNQEQTFGAPYLPMRQSDALLFQYAYTQNSDLFQQFIRFLFPISGREKRTQFLPTPFWGVKKPRYKTFKWERFESDHFDFFTYPEGQQSLNQVIQYFEQEYERNNRIFGVQSRFEKKIPIVLYQSRRDFEQTSIVDGPIPEGLGGLTEIFGWKRVTFPFEGQQKKFEHVAKHEATHVFQIAKKVRKLPLWFIEGSAETNSIYWDSDAEMMIRDAYLNGFFFSINELWQIQGSWLMYKIGNYVSNIIWDEYGEEGFYQIFNNANLMTFETNIKTSLGLSIQELDQKVQAKLLLDYGHLLKKQDVLDRSKKIKDERVLLDSRGSFHVSGGSLGAQNRLFLTYKNDQHEDEVVIVRDREYENESLESFRKGVHLSENKVVYAMKLSKKDELRLQSYQWDLENQKIKLGEVSSYSWEQIETIVDPVLVSDSEVVFIGYQNGYTDLYRVNLNDQSLARITHDRDFISGLDFCPKEKLFVFSREGQRDPKYIHYQKNLYVMDQTYQTEKITDHPERVHIEPSWSDDCNQILYVSNPEKTYDLFVYDRDQKKHQRLTHARIGVRKPSWSVDQTVLYNGYHKMLPSIYQMTFPTKKQMILEQGGSDNDFLIAMPMGTVQKSVTKEDEKPVLDGVYVYEQKPVIQKGKRPYTVDAYATLEDQSVLVRASQGLPKSGQIKEDYFSHYFEIQGKEVTALQSKMVAQKGVSQEQMSWIKTRLGGKAVMQSWTSQDQTKVFLTVNNRLVNDYKAFDKQPEVSIYIYDLKEDALSELPKGPLFSLSQTVQWVSFLDNQFVLLIIADQKKGPYMISLYDQKTKVFHNLAQDATQFRVSSDHTKMIWKASNYMFLDVTDALLEPKKIKIDQGRIQDLMILDRGTIGFVAMKESELLWIEIDPVTMKPVKTDKQIFEGQNIAKVLIHPKGMTLSIHQGKDKQQQYLWLWDAHTDQTHQVRSEKAQLTNLSYRDRYVLFSEKYPTAKPTLEYVFSIEKPDQIFELDTVHRSHIQQKNHWIVEGDKNFKLIDRNTNEVFDIAKEIIGFDIQGDDIVFSELSGDYYAIKHFDIQSKKKSTLTQGPYDLIKPIYHEGQIYFLQQEDQGKWKLQGTDQEKAYLSSFDVVDLVSIKESSEVVIKKKPKVTDRKPIHEEIPDYPMMVLSRPSNHKVKLRSLAAAAAFDGSDLRLLVSGFADNLYGDRGVFVNALFLGDTKFFTAGISNLEKSFSTSAFYNQRNSIENYGLNFTKDFIFDRYRQFSAYTEFEMQDYDSDSSVQNSFIDPSFDSNQFYLVKFGGIYAFDVTVRDLHGPIRGERLYFRTELGTDLENVQIANFDITMDVRLYQHVLPRVGLAHRLVGGFSQGPIPNVYLMGGNMSFRGIGFDDLQGQNYWVWSEDLRLPIFDFVGAKLFDPIDGFLGFLTRFFDVRTGVYVDVGSAWFNGDPMEVRYSAGYFINIPTSFGLIIRLHDGLFGEDRFGVWLGTNW